MRLVLPGPAALGVEMSRMLKHLYADDRGQDLIEYALLASLLAIVSVAALQLLGPKISNIFLVVRKAV